MVDKNSGISSGIKLYVGVSELWNNTMLPLQVNNDLIHYLLIVNIYIQEEILSTKVYFTREYWLVLLIALINISDSRLFSRSISWNKLST